MLFARLPTAPRITPIEKKWNLLANWDIFANSIYGAAKDNNGLLLDVEEEALSVDEPPVLTTVA